MKTWIALALVAVLPLATGCNKDGACEYTATKVLGATCQDLDATICKSKPDLPTVFHPGKTCSQIGYTKCNGTQCTK